MLQCPICKGYGKTVSTRNFDNAVVRYHKCEQCGESFTSTQRVNNLSITDENIKDILKSSEFRFATSPLFQAFSIDGYFYNNEDNKSPYDSNRFVLSSISFRDSKEHINSRFDIELSVLDDKATGVIKLVNVLKCREEHIAFPVAVVGTINFDKEWKVQLDLTVIHDILRDSYKQQMSDFIVFDAIENKKITFEELDNMTNEERENYIDWLRLKMENDKPSKESNKEANKYNRSYLETLSKL